MPRTSWLAGGLLLPVEVSRRICGLPAVLAGLGSGGRSRNSSLTRTFATVWSITRHLAIYLYFAAKPLSPRMRLRGKSNKKTRAEAPQNPVKRTRRVIHKLFRCRLVLTYLELSCVCLFSIQRTPVLMTAPALPVVLPFHNPYVIFFG